MLEKCKHCDCAVCSDKKFREIFKLIFKEFYPELYICEHAMYKITRPDANYFIIPQLDCIQSAKGKCYVIDPYTARPIFLYQNNFEIICSKSEGCTVEPFVTEYK